METDLTKLKCRDCMHYKLAGWWDSQCVCEIAGFPVDKDGPACASVNPGRIGQETFERMRTE